jgi:hypothetical protein
MVCTVLSWIGDPEKLPESLWPELKLDLFAVPTKQQANPVGDFRESVISSEEIPQPSGLRRAALDVPSITERHCVKPFECNSSVAEGRYYLRHIVPDSSNPFAGVLHYLTREYGGNVHTKGAVSITASANGTRECHQVADFKWNNYWQSQDEPNSWIQLAFNTRRISVTSYTVKSGSGTLQHPLQWSLGGSNDGVSWTALDQRQTQGQTGSYTVKTYQCPSQEKCSPSFFRFIRLTQTGLNASNDHILELANMDFYGDLDEHSFATD